ncbi:MAG: thrombospondin type 3 repeat-containing protein, partial [Gammaproteobacteria bacterium]|nr:thrombospondin type 3 repeat-containing protein [Gammaproteobacteria bacterium]
GLMFANPVAISFDLSNWEEPGTVLNLFVRTSPGGVFVDSGKTAIVDVSGLRATGAIDHFSVYAAIRVQAATQPPVLSRAQHFASQSSTFNDYRDALLRTGLLEGMTHPVLINRKSASSTNLGPFSAGLRVRASFDDPVFKTSALISIGPRSQFSADGWQLATTLKIPVIPGCDEGRLLDGTMVIDYPATSNSATLNIPFRVECLNELVVGRDSASSPLPAGVEEVVYQLSAGPKRVLMLRDRHKIYRFSRVDILAGGAVQVQDLARTIDDREPQQFWVTGDMTIEGSFDTNGKSGSPGGYGDNDFEAGGYGAAAGGGQYNAGSGGRGAPYTTNAPVLVQAHNDAIRRALCPLFPDFCPQAEIFMVSEITVYHGDPGPIARSGAVGGAGGKEWEAASAVTVAFEGARAVVSFATGDWIGAAEAAYGLIDESVKLLNNDKEMMASVGRGGGSVGASYDPRPDLAEFDFPRGGAGGGGAGAMTIAWPEGDESGGGGGAGGGGAPNLQLVVGGMLKILPGGMINGRGGYGGAGGRGGEYQAAPGGGGGGGRGAQIVIIAKGLDNKGVITTRGGLPGASGFISDGDEMGLVSTAFGKTGRNGAVRMQGSFLGSRPVDVTSYYVGPHIGRLNAEYFVSEDRFYNERPGDPNATVENGQWCPRVSLGYRPGSSSGSVFYVDPLLNSVALPRKIFETESGVQSREVCFPLQVGANRYAMRVNRENWNPGPDTPPGSIPTPGPFIEPHPWETQTVFYFPGLNDGDRDGLMDGAESFLGTNPQLADSDGDGLGDGYEIFQSHTDPKVSNFMQLTVSGVPGGVGQVSISPVGPWYTPNSSVTVSVLSGSSDYSFYQWRGDLTGNQNPATITMDKNKTIYAEFLYTQYTHPSGTLLPAKAVNTTTPTSSLGAPRVEMTAGGNAVIAWRQDNRIMARDFDATGGWGNTVDLGAAVNGQPQLATNIYGETILVWDHWDAANTRWQIYANRFNGEQRWHDPQLIAENAGKDINSPPTPLAATNDSLTVVLMWHVVSNDATSGVFTKRFETTTGWQTTKTINSPHGGEHQLALDNQGHAVLIWNVGGSVWARVLKKVGDYDQLIPAVRLSDAATSNNFDARVVLDRRNIIGNQGKATVVWAKGADIVSYRFAYKVDAIDSTGSRDVVDNRNTVAQTPHIVIDQRNNVLAVWKQGTDLWSNQYIEDWGHWLTPTLIEQNSAIPGEPRLRIDGYGNAMALWGQGGEIHLARYLAAQGWQPDNVIATPATNTVIDAPRLDLDQNGNAFALWRVWSESATTGEIALRYFSTSTTDTDGDGLTDAEEFVYYGTDAYAADTDGDTFSDGDEVTAGTDPLDKLSHP